jgi:hypothetical protein
MFGRFRRPRDRAVQPSWQVADLPGGSNAAPVAQRSDVTADGKRFLSITSLAPSTEAPITLVLNWTALLKN